MMSQILSMLPDCPNRAGSYPDIDCMELIMKAGLQPTRQRMVISELLFA